MQQRSFQLLLFTGMHSYGNVSVNYIFIMLWTWWNILSFCHFKPVLQMRDDFLKNRIDEYMTDVSLEKLLGLALLDLLRLAKELELKVEWIKNQDPERYIFITYNNKKKETIVKRNYFKFWIFWGSIWGYAILVEFCARTSVLWRELEPNCSIPETVILRAPYIF